MSSGKQVETTLDGESKTEELNPEVKYLWWIEFQSKFAPWRIEDVFDRMQKKKLSLIQAIKEHVAEK